jgi:hypothetical protein
MNYSDLNNKEKIAYLAGQANVTSRLLNAVESAKQNEIGIVMLRELKAIVEEGNKHADTVNQTQLDKLNNISGIEFTDELIQDISNFMDLKDALKGYYKKKTKVLYVVISNVQVFAYVVEDSADHKKGERFYIDTTTEDFTPQTIHPIYTFSQN